MHVSHDRLSHTRMCNPATVAQKKDEFQMSRRTVTAFQLIYVSINFRAKHESLLTFYLQPHQLFKIGNKSLHHFDGYMRRSAVMTNDTYNHHHHHPSHVK